ncbi:MAG: AmmeMemoRadiSam system protein A [Gammaproteobacteria bacterium]
MFNKEAKNILLQLAKDSIDYGLHHHRSIPVHVNEYPADLQDNRACFVTLKLNDQLRGCIGSLTAYRPLVEDVANNAYAAAFEDPRFPAVSNSEFQKLHYHISVLSVPQEFPVTSEDDLLSKLQVGEDGLILTDNGYRATFLPSVWESLSSPKQFVTELKRKAGLPMDYWSDTIQFQRYRAENIEME